MSDTSPSKIGALVKLVAAVVAAGALVAGMLLPFVGGSGLIARNSASLLDALPVELTDQTPNGNTTVLAADGSVITNFYENNRTPVTGDQISEVMKQALVDIEDSRFYEHNGLDVQGTLRALATNIAAGGVAEGGSTLTQQLVKQTLLQTADTPEERTAATEQSGIAGITRKLREARLALALEQTYSKDEILTRYLNIAYFGSGAYGIQAAAQRYFSVNAIDLDLAQASVLAGLVQSPTDDDPLTEPAAAQTRRDQVLDRMDQLGDITDQEMADVSAAPIPVAEGASPPRGCVAASVGGYFCDYLQSYLTGTLHLTQSQLDNGGYTIQTTLRPDLQRSGDQAILGRVATDSTFAAVMTAVQPGTGHVLAMSSNRQYGCSADQGIQCEAVNLNVVAQAGAGSTYKVFTAATALAAGYGAHYSITAPQPYTSRVYKGTNASGRYGPLVVQNDDPNYKPTYDMTSALVASTNTYFVALEDALGSIEPIVQTSQAMGMHYDNPVTQYDAATLIANNSGTFTLGPDATSPLDLAEAYATVAASGTHCDATPVVSVTTYTGEPATAADGSPLYAGDACTAGAIAPAVADTLVNMLRGVVSAAGTGRRAQIVGHDIAGKTGTTQQNKTAAFVGVTPDYAAAVMYFDPKGQAFVGGVGGGTPGQIWHDAMAPILANEPNHPFPAADPATSTGTKGPGPGAYTPPPSTTPSGGGGGAGTTPAPTTTAPTTATPPAEPPDTDGDGQPG